MYAPRDRGERETFFGSLRWISALEEHVLLGGEFNCTLDAEFDRSRIAAAGTAHRSRALANRIDDAELIDVLASDMVSRHSKVEIDEFRRDQHTYFYTGAGGALASSRLDWWYVLLPNSAWIIGTEVPERRGIRIMMVLSLGWRNSPNRASLDGERRCTHLLRCTRNEWPPRVHSP